MRMFRMIMISIIIIMVLGIGIDIGLSAKTDPPDPTPDVTIDDPTPDPTPDVTIDDPTPDPTPDVTDPIPKPKKTPKPKKPTPTITIPPIPTDPSPTPTLTPTDPSPTSTPTDPLPPNQTDTPIPTPNQTTPIPNATTTPNQTEPAPNATAPAPNVTVTPNQTTPKSSSGSGGTSTNNNNNNGGGSSFFVSKDSNGNIFKYETREQDLITNKSVEYTFSTTDFTIYKILVNGKNNEDQISVRIDDLKNKSVYAKESAPGLVYRNENVWINSKRLNYISVMFKVKNSWLNETNDSKNPYLLKWNGTTWLVLKTDNVGKDDMYSYFEAPKAGSSQLSIFAISSPPKRINKTVQMVAQQGEQEEYISPNIEEVEKILPKKTPGFSGIIFLIGIILSFIYMKRLWRY